METEKLTREQVIRNGGFYDNNNRWNSIITIPGDNNLYRHRLETLIIKDHRLLFLKRRLTGEYYLPGGSVERDIPDIDQAATECKEEAYILVDNIQNTGISYLKKYDAIPAHAKEIEKEFGISWAGNYTDIYVADFKNKYNGYIDPIDRDGFIKSGSFVLIKDALKYLRKEHREAILFYLRSKNIQEVTTESYIGNYFKNKILLKKISKNPDLQKENVDDVVKVLVKQYKKLNKDPEVIKIRKSKKVSETFYPVLEFEFPDKQVVNVAICFDEHEISDGVAMHLDDLGDYVVVYPCFFKTTRENQIFTLLHEFGHIRLKHLEVKNSKRDIFGNDTYLDYRRRLMDKGRVMYSEVNADLYAVLNGASMYSIMGSYFNKDKDGEYDYRFTNEELANRYRKVFRKYTKLRGYGEKVELSNLELDSNTLSNIVESYNGSDKDKDTLYTILYRYCIAEKYIDDNYYKSCKDKYEDTLNMYYESDNEKEREMLEQKVFNDYLTLEFAKNTAYDNKCKKYKYTTEAVDKFKENLINTTESIINKIKIKDPSSNLITILESVSAEERKKIPLEKFGVPRLRKYPLDKKEHVISAIRLFGHTDSKYTEEEVEELAHRIFKAMEEYNIDKSIIGKKSKLRKYLDK